MREKTPAEFREALLEHVYDMVGEWESLPGKTVRARLEGLAHSMLAMLDGASIGVPKCIVAPDPHPEDRRYLRARGEDWWPENHDVPVRADVGGTLHDGWNERRARS